MKLIGKTVTADYCNEEEVTGKVVKVQPHPHPDGRTLFIVQPDDNSERVGVTREEIMEVA